MKNANNLAELVSNIQGMFIDAVGDGNVSDYELSMLAEAIQLPINNVPTAKILISDSISKLLDCKSNLNYLLAKLRTSRYEVYKKHSSQYNYLFTVLTRQQRPSKAAIDAEIYYSNPDLVISRDKMESYDSIIDFITNHIEILNSVVKNLESRKYD